MPRNNRFITASLLLALMSLLWVAPGAEAQGLVFYPEVTGTLGANGWYTDDVFVTWPAEPGWIVEQGCQDTLIDYDTPPEGVLLVCLWTDSPGGELYGGAVVIQRDATPPQIVSVSPTFPLAADEGSSLTVDASAADAHSGIASLAWDLDGDGAFESPNLTQYPIPDSKQGQISPEWIVKATDVAGNESTLQVVAQVAIDNVEPSIAPPSAAVDGVDLAALGGLPLGLEVVLTAAFADPGVEDSHTASIDWGDGTAGPGLVVEQGGTGTASGSHTYFSEGPHTVAFAVTDDEGAEAVLTYQAAVLTAGQSFAALRDGTLQMVADGSLTEGQGSSLLVKSGVAQALYQGGWLVAADPVLQAYQNELLALRGVIEPQWLVAEGLQGFIEFSIDPTW
jgi:hypothetical protein